MPRTPRSRQIAEAATDPAATVSANGTAEASPDPASGAERPAGRAPRRRAPRAAASAPVAATLDDSTTETVAEVLGNTSTPAAEPADSTIQTTEQLRAADPAPDPTEAPRPARRRGRGRRSTDVVDEVDAATADSAAAESPPVASEDAVTPTAEALPSPATDAPPVTASSAAPASAWTMGRRYEIGPDGRVRFVDDAAPTQATPSPVAEPVQDEEPVEAPAALIETEDTVIAETISTADAAGEPDETAASPDRRRGRRGRGHRRERIDAAEVSASTVEEIVSVSAVEEGEAFLDDADTETAAALDEGLIEGEAAPETAEGEAQRTRRRSRRGGRGRRRTGFTPDPEINAEFGERMEPELARSEGIALPDEIEAEPEPLPFRRPTAPAARGRSEGSGSSLSPLEALMARQNVLLEQFMQRQEKMARAMEQAVLSVEGRLRGTDLSRVSAMPRLGVFVDVPNIMYAAERYKKAVDFGKLLDYVSRDRTLIRASAYAPISDDPSQRLELQRFVEPFVNHGYRIVTKPLKRFNDGSIKANFDVELAMDILTMSDRLDIVSLVSGDGDFSRLVNLVASRGVRVEVVAFSQSTAAELKAVADSYVDLTQHLNDLCFDVEGDFRPRVPRPRIDISGYNE